MLVCILLVYGFLALYTYRSSIAEKLFNTGTNYAFRVKEENLPSEFTPRENSAPVESKTKSAIVSMSSDDEPLVGQKIRVRLMVDPGGQAINVAGVNIRYSTSTLSFIEVDNSSSSFSIFLDDGLYGNNVSVAAFQPSPGISTTSNIVSLVFDVIGIGESAIEYVGRPEILANDGFGTNVLWRKINYNFFVEK